MSSTLLKNASSVLMQHQVHSSPLPSLGLHSPKRLINSPLTLILYTQEASTRTSVKSVVTLLQASHRLQLLHFLPKQLVSDLMTKMSMFYSTIKKLLNLVLLTLLLRELTKLLDIIPQSLHSVRQRRKFGLETLMERSTS